MTNIAVCNATSRTVYRAFSAMHYCHTALLTDDVLCDAIGCHKYDTTAYAPFIC